MSTDELTVKKIQTVEKLRNLPKDDCFDCGFVRTNLIAGKLTVKKYKL